MVEKAKGKSRTYDLDISECNLDEDGIFGIRTSSENIRCSKYLLQFHYTQPLHVSPVFSWSLRRSSFCFANTLLCLRQTHHHHGHRPGLAPREPWELRRASILVAILSPCKTKETLNTFSPFLFSPCNVATLASIFPNFIHRWDLSNGLAPGMAWGRLRSEAG